MPSAPRPGTLALALAFGCGPSAGAGDGDAGATESSSTAPTITGDPAGDSVDPTTATTATTASTTVDDTSGETTSEPADSTSSEDTGPAPADGLTHLLIVRTPHGVYEDQVWAGSGDDFVLGPVLEPLAPWSDALALVDGVENSIHLPEGAELTNMYGVTSSSILTGGLLGSASGEPPWVYYAGGGPSLDVVLGEALGVDTPHTNVHLGVDATDFPGMPTGVSYTDVDQPLPPIDSPMLAFESLFAGIDDPLVDALADRLAEPIDGAAQTLEVQLAIAATAIQLDVTRVQLVSVDRGLPDITWSEVGLFAGYHEVVASDDHEGVQNVQTLWAQQIAALLATLEAVPDGAGNLLDRTLVVWMSAEGSPPNGYSTQDVFIVIVDRSGTFATGRIASVEADQADFAATVADAMGVALGEFGHPDLAATVVDELLAP